MRNTITRFMAVIGAVAATFLTAGTAHAANPVPPGGSGNVCGNYQYVTVNPNRYWQVCAWADNNEVYFTVHFGNTSGSTWYVDDIDLYYARSGNFYNCPASQGSGLYYNFPVPANSTAQTLTNKCAIPRTSAAYAAYAWVTDGTYSKEWNSPTLQVQ
ncbi:MAG TPA: hypothetical protein VM677_21200 [Actinokineospora sp.]|nr:hypothetical protein [Actinokineospora sp.]